jgi:phosphoglycolate phosphatase-like HAD superfamily hydrolase
MDGTLTVPCIDFGEMRRRVGVTGGTDILDHIATLPEARQAEAFAVIAEIEEKAIADMALMPGALALCAALDGAGLPRGLITRNVRRGVEALHAAHFSAGAGPRPFHPAITRQCAFAYKPSPEALLHICATWRIHPSECAMVGDSAKDDIASANRAGAIGVLLAGEGHDAAALVGDARPHFTVRAPCRAARLNTRPRCSCHWRPSATPHPAPRQRPDAPSPHHLPSSRRRCARWRRCSGCCWRSSSCCRRRARSAAPVAAATCSGA